MWVRADARNGYSCEYEVYVGKSAEGREHGLGGSVMKKKLSQRLSGKNYHIFCDNYFTSSGLLQDLMKNQIYCCGTTNLTRVGFPEDLKSVTLERGVVATAWRDKRVVTMLSTLCSPDDTQIFKRREKDGSFIQVPCPQAIMIYNKYMGGVDKGDQMKQYYRVRLKSRKNYKYLFWYAFEVAVANSYILTKFSPNTSLLPSQRNLKKFRLTLAEKLIGTYCSKKRAG